MFVLIVSACILALPICVSPVKLVRASTEWTQTYTHLFAGAHTMISTKDGGYILVGYTPDNLGEKRRFD